MITDKSRLRRAAEHEAAHAVVADALGMAVGEVRINDDGTGSCEYRSGGRVNDATVAIAGALWIGKYRWQMWPGQAEVGCEHDMRTLAVCDDFDRREAQRRADAILSQRGKMVESFAEHLMQKRRAGWDHFRREVDQYVSDLAAAIRDHGRDAVMRHLDEGMPLPARTQVRRDAEPPPGWRRATNYPAANRAAAPAGSLNDFWQQQEAYRDAWAARQQLQGVGL